MKRTVSIYGQVLRTYARWAPSLILLAAIVFVPLGLVHAITVHAEIGSLDFEGGLKIFAAVTALLALAATGLLGEVFYRARSPYPWPTPSTGTRRRSPVARSSTTGG